MANMFLANRDELMNLASGEESDRPLGSALVVCLGEQALVDLSIAVKQHARTPWCPLVLAAREPPDPGTLSGLGLDAPRLGTIDLPIDQDRPSVVEVSLAVSRRGAPDPACFRRYVAERCGAAAADAAAAALEGSFRWTSGLRRQLDRLGMPSPQHWLNLFWLTHYLSAAAPEDGRTLEQVALEYGRAPRTLSWWCAKYLRCSWPEARRRLGWEWILESAIAASGGGPESAEFRNSSPVGQARSAGQGAGQ